MAAVNKYSCSLCGFKFSKKKFMINHLKLCEDIEDPSGKWVPEIVLKEEPFQDGNLDILDKNITEPKLEKLEVTKTGQTIELMKGEPQNYDGNHNQSEESTQLNENLESEVVEQELFTREHSFSPYKCTKCNYATPRSTNIRAHIIMHTGQKQFKCNICDFASHESWRVHRHLKTHTEESPREKQFKCTDCNYATANKYHLQRHMKTHTGEREYKCTKCNFASIQSWHLQRHMKTHTGEREFKCNECNFASIQRWHLRRHIRKMHRKSQEENDSNV